MTFRVFFTLTGAGTTGTTGTPGTAGTAGTTGTTGGTDLRVFDLTFRVFFTLTGAGGGGTIAGTIAGAFAGAFAGATVGAFAGATAGAAYEEVNAMGMILRRLFEKSASFCATIPTNALKKRWTISLLMRPSYSEVPINAKVSHDRVRTKCSFCFPSFVVRFTRPVK